MLAMKRIFILLFAFAYAAISFSQSDSLEFDKKARNRYVIGLVPSAARNIYGIAIGLVGSEAICDRPYTKHTDGLNIQILGQGIFLIFQMKNVTLKDMYISKDDSATIKSDTIPLKAVHNGLLISPLGTLTPKVNGISISPFMSYGKEVNGISINLLWNLYNYVNGASIGLVNTTGSVRGVQIGLLNKTADLRGFQFGLWNKNERRSLPLINWNFKAKKAQHLSPPHWYGS
jgi:hypothetical protein